MTVLYVSAVEVDTAIPETLSDVGDSFNIVEVASSDEAIRAVVERSIDCVVCERDVSGGCSIELVRSIRNVRPKLPIILYTQDGTETVASEAISAGVTDYVMQSRDEGCARLADAIECATDEMTPYDDSFQRAVSDAGHGIVVTDANGRIEYANSVFERLSGYSLTELLGRTPQVVNSGTHDDSFFETLWDTILDGEVWRDKLVNRRRNGELYVVDKTIAPITDGGEITGFVGISTDITDRIQYENAVEETRDGVVVVNRDMEFVLVNDAFVLLTGIPSDWMLQQNLTSFGESGVVDAETYQQFREHVESVVGGDATERRFETSFVSPVMGEIVVDARLTAIGDSDLTQGAVVSLRNVSERKARERELEAKNDRLEEFAGTISHDLRNPLNVAVSNLELARESCQTDSLETVASAHDRMEELIDDFLSLSRDGNLIGTTVSVSLAAVANEAWQNVETRDATLRLAADRTVSADAARLRQLLENLFRNSVEHGSTGSQNSTSSGDDGPGDGVAVSVGLLDGGFYVADDGQGIPAAERDTVFAAGHTTSETGTGLGLMIVSRIADGHGWTVDLTESETGGARFEITGLDRVER